MTLSFLSPITPLSTLRQALPAAYFTVHVEGQHRVHVYTDVNGQWVSGNRDSEIVWDLSKSSEAESSSPTKSWKVTRKTEQLFTEINDRSEWGSLYFTGPAYTNHQAGTSELLRRRFAEHGRLTNDVDTGFRRIMDHEPVFAFSTTISPSSKDSEDESVTFTLSLIQDPVVQFAAARGLTYMRPLWASYIPRTEDMISYHYSDYHDASLLASNYSRQLALDARASGSESYEDIVALSARQILGATQFSGTPEAPIIFLKEISSNGNFQTVDVIFPSFPFFLYTNPRWLVYLLQPLIEHQLSGQYPNKYSMHDIGTHFPNATGHADGRDEYMPVEECGDMLIMGLAVVNSLRHGTTPAWSTTISPGKVLSSLPQVESAVSGSFGLSVDSNGIDGIDLASEEKYARKWVKESYGLWKQWAGYLIRESLIPHNQLCTDDFAGWLANQTNLALKGIIGIRAMSDMSEFIGQSGDAKYYKNISDVYIDKWQDYGISRDGTHAKLAYTWYGSWTTIYNLFADALLCFHLPKDSGHSSSEAQKTLKGGSNEHFIPDKIYSMQSKWYRAVLQRYGLPLDSRHLYTKSDWEFFAGAVASRDTREALVESIGLWVNETVTGKSSYSFWVWKDLTCHRPPVYGSLRYRRGGRLFSSQVHGEASRRGALCTASAGPSMLRKGSRRPRIPRC